MAKVIRLYNAKDLEAKKILEEYLCIRNSEDLEKWKRKYPHLVYNSMNLRGNTHVE